MYAEHFESTVKDKQSNTFYQFQYELLRLLENAKYWTDVEHLIAVLADRDTLEHLVNSLESSDAKDGLSKYLAYDSAHYSKLTTGMAPVLRAF